MLCCKAFLDADDDSITALTDLGSTEHPTERVIAGIEKLVCLLYKPKTHITNVKDLRWLLFRKSQAQSERLPPTQASLKESILRAHYQWMVWHTDIVPNPQLLHQRIMDRNKKKVSPNIFFKDNVSSVLTFSRF